jgi:hypothetical protein
VERLGITQRRGARGHGEDLLRQSLAPSLESAQPLELRVDLRPAPHGTEIGELPFRVRVFRAQLPALVFQARIDLARESDVPLGHLLEQHSRARAFEDVKRFPGASELHEERKQRAVHVPVLRLEDRPRLLRSSDAP